MAYLLRCLPLPTLAMAAGLALVPAEPAHACSSEPYVGAVCTVAANYCPESYLPADGRLMTIQTNAGLYSLVGVTYGGDGKTTFALPDLRAQTPVGTGIDSDGQKFYLGNKSGTDQHVLTSANLPAHTHTATYTPSPGGAYLQSNLTWQVEGAVVPATGSQVPSTATPYLGGNSSTNGKIWAPNPVALSNVGGLTVNTAGTIAGKVTNDVTGAGAPATMLPPQTPLTYCIAISGYYPPRD